MFPSIINFHGIESLQIKTPKNIFILRELSFMLNFDISHQKVALYAFEILRFAFDWSALYNAKYSSSDRCMPIKSLTYISVFTFLKVYLAKKKIFAH